MYIYIYIYVIMNHCFELSEPRLKFPYIPIVFFVLNNRTKLKQTEVDCEYLKRCCEGLTEENRRLQKEVQELRALKLSPQFYMQMTPPTTLTMCPSCERVAVPPPPPPSSTTSSTAPISTPVDPRSHPIVSARSIPGFNPWANTPVAHRPFDALHSRS